MHRFSPGDAYMVTAGTYRKLPLFRGSERLQYLCEMLLELAGQCAWQLQAWAVFPNHYHFVALSPPSLGCGGPPPPKAGASSRTPNGPLAELIRHFHSVTAIQANRWDQVPGRQAWFQYWDTQLTFEKSYLARLGYVHKNAVHHGIVREPSLYPWCSAGWFQRRATTCFYKTVMEMKVDHVRVEDDYPVAASDV
jgi:putative transposase